MLTLQTDAKQRMKISISVVNTCNPSSKSEFCQIYHVFLVPQSSSSYLKEILHEVLYKEIIINALHLLKAINSTWPQFIIIANNMD